MPSLVGEPNASFPTRKLLATCIALTLPLTGFAELPAQAEESVPELSPIEVEAEKESDDHFISQEKISKTNKAGTKIIDTPAAISVVDKQFIIDTGAKNIQEALQYTSGVYSGGFGFDTRIDAEKIRGVNASMYLDGLRSLYGSYNSVRTNVYSLEHIEVLKGPSSALYGQSDLGGIVNGVSKLPKEEQQGEIWAQVGSFDRKQLATDITGPLTDDGKWLYRVVALARDSDTQVNYVEDDGYVLAPSLTWRPADGTEFTVLVNRQENTGQVSNQFLPSKGTLDPAPLGPIPIDTFVGEPGWDRYDREKTEITFFLNQRLNDHWDLSAVLRKTESATETREHYANVSPLAAPDDAGNMTRTIYMADRDTDILNFDIRAQGQFALGITEHTLTLGLDRQDALWEESNYVSDTNGGTINLYNPVYGYLNTAALANATDRPDNEIKQTGLYVIDSIEIGRTVVSAALRYDESENKTLAPGSTNTVSNDDETTGRIGVMYRFDNGIRPYLSYSQSFAPNLGTDGSGNSLDATRGTQEEAGLKYLSARADLSIDLAWFNIEEENRIQQGNLPGSISQVGATVEGWEIEAKKRWGQAEILAAFTKLDAVDDETQIRLPYLADEIASLWGKYEFVNGFRAGLGARYIGDNVGYGGSPLLPSATVYDAMVGYRLENWDFSVDAKNLTDEEYLSWCRYQGSDCTYAERLNITGNVRYSF